VNVERAQKGDAQAIEWLGGNLVARVAWSLYRHHGIRGKLPWEDWLAYAHVCFLKTLSSFDPKKGRNFGNYYYQALYWKRGHLMRQAARFPLLVSELSVEDFRGPGEDPLEAGQVVEPLDWGRDGECLDPLCDRPSAKHHFLCVACQRREQRMKKQYGVRACLDHGTILYSTGRKPTCPKCGRDGNFK